MIVMLGSLKGGVGKTTIATNLAALLAGMGVEFALVDADRQRSAAKWAERRGEVANPVLCPEKLGQGLFQFLQTLHQRAQVVLVDAAGRDSVEMRQAMLAADVMLVPLAPSQLDIETLDELQETIRLAKVLNPGLAVRVVVNQAETGRGRDELMDAKETLMDYPEMQLLDTVLCRRKVYRQAVRAGYGVVESDNSQAKAEIQLLAGEIFGELTA